VCWLSQYTYHLFHPQHQGSGRHRRTLFNLLYPSSSGSDNAGERFNSWPSSVSWNSNRKISLPPFIHNQLTLSPVLTLSVLVIPVHLPSFPSSILQGSGRRRRTLINSLYPSSSSKSHHSAESAGYPCTLIIIFISLTPRLRTTPTDASIRSWLSASV